MTFEEFQSHVAAYLDHYRGVRPHSQEELAAFEATLGHAIPLSIRWLLGKHGYAEATGIDSLSESVETTLRFRKNFNLPTEWLVLNDWNDAGIVLINLNSERVVWCATHHVDQITSGDILDDDVEWFQGYAEWTVSQLEDATDDAS